ncbi:U-box domain-containing protein 12-like [Phalaenopsis equestris]|uniref:U-box domain-containing protein 12-like n=1 Tax=Phalaenopsis equestris TaxID=78828 RepID=UPI0009E508EA|nr:U-box domain-containing protein 12-like [Phalaenopsis equestris]
MAKCEVLAGARWSTFSPSGFRRRLLEAMLCGASNQPRRKSKERQSDRLADLLEAAAIDSRCREADEKRRKMEAFEELQSVVRRLQETEEGFHGGRAEAAAEVRRLAKDNSDFRQALAMLGAIPPLVSLLDCNDADSLIAALYALLNLAVGNEANKSAIVRAGAVRKMVFLIESGPSPAATDAIIANILGLSALDANKPIIGASPGVIPFLLNSLRNSSSISSNQSKDDALRALYNLSISPANGAALVEAGIVPCILDAVVYETEFSERSLSVLSNLVVASPEGRQAVSRFADGFSILIDVLNWSEFPRCQEKAAYILMVMVHKSQGGERAAMVAAGLTSALLELALIGSALAQKRASRILELLREENGKQVMVSEPISGGCSGAPASSATMEEEEGMSVEMREVRKLVKQSLQSTMRRIERRANFPAEFAPSDRFKELTVSSTSKSLTLW